MQLSTGAMDASSAQVAHVMHRNPTLIYQEDTVQRAAQMMSQVRSACMGVINGCAARMRVVT